MADSVKEWEPVCRAEDLEFERGVSALVHGQSIAIFRTAANEFFALGNHDPFARGSVLARGIVGLRRGVPFVGSPAHRHAFDLRSGRCLEDDSVSVPAYDVKVVDGMVLVGGRLSPDPRLSAPA
jgi:nitrite reductase (NADH) small subunit